MTSRLSQMQARFQQKQQEVKEQTMVEMFQNAQAKTINRLSPANNQHVSIQTHPGKVRQMFEERRSKAGIDKSYPLQPLNNGVVKTSTNTKNGVHSYKSSSVYNDGDKQVRQDAEIKVKRNGNVASKSQNIRRIEIVTKTFKDVNLNNEENLEDVTFPETPSLDFADSAESIRLPNVGGSLPSQRTTKKLGELKVNGVKRATAPAQRPAPPKTLETSAPRTLKTGVSSPGTKFKSVGSPSPVTPIRAHTPSKSFASTPNKTPSKTISSPLNNNNAALKPKSPSIVADGPVPEGCCKICRRKFAPDRLAKHETICMKTATKKRKQYDAVKHRVAGLIDGTEVESYVRHSKKTATKPAKAITTQAPKKDWRKTHEEFINAIRAAKEVQAHIKKGGKLSDLPPPPPSDTSDYISCPHCNRRFNQSAAERHIPKCANFQFNKPKPVSKKR